jgi:hypothetical protein
VRRSINVEGRKTNYYGLKLCKIVLEYKIN